MSFRDYAILNKESVLIWWRKDERKYKYGQFGYGKYVYTKEQLDEMKDFFVTEIKAVFPNSLIKYVI